MFGFGNARIARVFRSCAVVLFAATMLPISGAAAVERPTDFSAGLLSPADVAEFGFDDYGVDSGRFMSLPQMIRDSGGPNWDDPVFEEAGIERVYVMQVHPIGGLDEHSGPDINFSSIIFVFEDEETADEGFDFYHDESDDPTATDHDDAPSVGDESELTEYVDVWEEDGETREYHGFDFTFRIGTVMATVSIHGYDETLDRDMVDELGIFFFEKIETLLEDGEVNGGRPPALDLLVPRYEGIEVLPSRSHYCVIDGEAVLHAYDPGADEVSNKRIDRFDLVANYCNIQKLLIGESADEYLLLNVEPNRFKTSSGAGEYIATTIQESGDTIDSFEAEEVDVDDLPFEVDEAWVYSYNRQFGDFELEVTELVVRDGKYVYEVRLNGFEAPPIDVLVDVMSDTMTCAEEPCTTTLDLPESVLDHIEDQAEIYADL